MPSDMRLQCPSEDTPPSTRPPSVASSAASGGPPHRSTSMDSLNTNSSISDKPVGEEYIPTRLIRATPKANANAMQFVKTGPATLHKSAKEQMKKAEVVKSLRKTSLQEEEEWQSTLPTANLKSLDEGSDWQSNLDKWKSGRRKRNEDILERVIEVRKNEQDDEFNKARRKSKEFTERNKRGRRFNLVVHDDDNNDLADLGIGTGKSGSSLSDPPEETEVRYADTKSDAGFCTGSDTGSDGVFAEDNISDTSSALGDKREIHDSLLDSSSQKDGDVIVNGHHVISTATPIKTTMSEYTYDKAIEEYKQFAENSAKKRTSSVTSLSSNASGSRGEEEKVHHRVCVTTSTSSSKKMEEKMSLFDGSGSSSSSFDRFEKVEPKFIRREKNAAKVDIDKRRSMFELRDIDTQETRRTNRRSIDVSTTLRNKVASFENLTDSENRARGITPPRDTKFKEKLASFSLKEKGGGEASPRKKTPERDQNFYQKLHNFTQIERKTSPERKFDASKRHSMPRSVSSLKATERKCVFTPERRVSERYSDRRAPPPTPLKDRIASFENLSPQLDSSPTRREMSVSMECLDKPLYPTEGISRSSSLVSSQSVTNLFRRTPSTPFMVVEVDEDLEEKTCMKGSVEMDYEMKSPKLEISDDGMNKAILTRVESVAEIAELQNAPQVAPPRIPESPPPKRPEVPPRQPEVSVSRALLEIPAPRILPEIPDGRAFRTLPEAPEVRAARVLPETPEVRASRTLPAIPDTFSCRNLPEAPLRIPEVPPPLVPEVPDDCPPPVPPPRVPAREDPHEEGRHHVMTSEMTSVTSVTSSSSSSSFLLLSQTRHEEEEDQHIQYGDNDIDEAMDNYEQLSEAITIGDGGAFDATPPSSLENVYEKISDEDPVYENIYEKVNEEREETHEQTLDHHYQTLDEVKTERETLPPTLPQTLSPTLPPKNKPLSVFEVLDVTWTEDNSSSPAAPPSVPPPPPPAEDEGEELDAPPPPLAENTVQNESVKAASSSPQTTKQDLRKKMSDFLGSKPQVEEELTLQPPPDANELLRQEREAERLIVQKQACLNRESPLMDFDFPGGGAPFGRPKYTWEDRMKADVPKMNAADLDESTDHLEFQTKLAELEQEMVTHDRSMLQRVKGPMVPDEPIYSQDLASSVPPPSQYTEKQAVGEMPPTYSEPMTNTPPLAPTTASPTEPPPPLPIQEFYTAPTFTKYEGTESAYESSNQVMHQTVCSESTTITRDVNRVFDSAPEPLPSKALPQAPPPIPRKQSILALSAIPKPKLTDNDSWIMKRKAEAGKKDYSKHWLIQEAEQRRLEQQERISRPSQLPLATKPSNTFQTTPGFQNHFQNMKSSFHSTTSSTTTYNQPASIISNGSNGSPITPTMPVSFPNNSNSNTSLHTTNDTSNKYTFNNGPSTGPSNSPSNSSSSSNNSWKKQTKTYQPPQPSPPSGSNKPLPDAIINTITQRVNNKNKVNGSTRTTVYNSTNYRDDNYHDYMNTDTFNPVHTNNSPVIGTPVSQGQQGAVHLPPASQQGLLSEDQRLLSVSGKKKCSHCGEELGRGAAMIIESLRLFYHIPCFKCCVCGTQLGNGTSGADVRVRNHKLHCHNCYSNDEGMKFSKV